MTGEHWRSTRDVELAALAAKASALLVGRTIVATAGVPHMDECDSPNVLRLTLDNGDVIDIRGGYEGYTGHSCDEYVEVISLERRQGSES